MPVTNKSTLEVLNNKGEYIFTISLNDLTGDVALFEEKGDIEDTTGFYVEISKGDWESVKYFIDGLFTFDSLFINKKDD